MTNSLSALAASLVLVALIAYQVTTAPEGYEHSFAFHYGRPPVLFARCSHLGQVFDIAAERRGDDRTSRQAPHARP